MALLGVGVGVGVRIPLERVEAVAIGGERGGEGAVSREWWSWSGPMRWAGWLTTAYSGG